MKLKVSDGVLIYYNHLDLDIDEKLDVLIYLKKIKGFLKEFYTHASYIFIGKGEKN